MTKKYIEQLTVDELKYAFAKYLNSKVTLDRSERAQHWEFFWNEIKKSCSIVERL